MNNNFSTGYFKIDRGTRQGDPLSAYIFILCLEIFFIQVRSNTSIRGFKYNGIEIKLTAFADDTMFLVREEIRKWGFWCKLPLFNHFCGVPVQ